MHGCMELYNIHVPNLFVMYAISVTGHLRHGLLDWRKDRVVGKKERKNEHYCVYLGEVCTNGGACGYDFDCEICRYSPTYGQVRVQGNGACWILILF